MNAETSGAGRWRGHPALVPLLALYLLLGITTAVVGVFYYQRPVKLDNPVSAPSPNEKFLASAVTVRELRILDNDYNYWRFQVQNRAGEVCVEKDVEISVHSLSPGPRGTHVDPFFFEDAGQITWSADSRKVVFSMHDYPLFTWKP